MTSCLQHSFGYPQPCWLSPVFLMPTHCLMMSAGVLGLQGMQEWDLWKTESVCRNVLNQKDVLQKLALDILATKLSFSPFLGYCSYELSLQVAQAVFRCFCEMLLRGNNSGGSFWPRQYSPIAWIPLKYVRLQKLKYFSELGLVSSL